MSKNLKIKFPSQEGNRADHHAIVFRQMKKGFLQSLSANAAQLMLNQLFGLGIFYILSTRLDKATFGQINLALAILLTIFSLLPMGVDQLMVKKIASGENRRTMLSLFLFHVTFTGFAVYLVVGTGWIVFGSHSLVYSLLLVIGIGKLMMFFSAPFKQITSGSEQFKVLAYMSVVSNLVRCACLIMLVYAGRLLLWPIVFVFLAGDCAELICSVWLYGKYIGGGFSLRINISQYLELLREALPQTGVVLITSALARFDWIFIGLMLSAVKLAEYSFAYKVFEMSALPLTAIAPVLIPKFTRMVKRQSFNTDELKRLVRYEMVVSAFVILAINIAWAPVIDSITGGKYGQVNVATMFILSLCLPLLFINNFLWTLYFAQGRLKMILTAFIITLAVNISGDVVLIPACKNEGAALAFLLASVSQAVYFLYRNEIKELNTVWQPLIICVACAIAAKFGASLFTDSLLFSIIIAFIVFAALLIITGQIKPGKSESLKTLLSEY